MWLKNEKEQIAIQIITNCDLPLLASPFGNKWRWDGTQGAYFVKSKRHTFVIIKMCYKLLSSKWCGSRSFPWVVGFFLCVCGTFGRVSKFLIFKIEHVIVTETVTLLDLTSGSKMYKLKNQKIQAVDSKAKRYFLGYKFSNMDEIPNFSQQLWIFHPI